MSDHVERGPCTEAAYFRVYKQADGRYIAFGSVEVEGGPRPPVVKETAPYPTAQQALGEALKMTGFVK